jgi:hypothetical protein
LGADAPDMGTDAPDMGTDAPDMGADAPDMVLSCFLLRTVARGLLALAFSPWPSRLGLLAPAFLPRLPRPGFRALAYCLQSLLKKNCAGRMRKLRSRSEKKTCRLFAMRTRTC